MIFIIKKKKIELKRGLFFYIKFFLKLSLLSTLLLGCVAHFKKVSLTNKRSIELKRLKFSDITYLEKIDYKKALQSFKTGCLKIEPSSLFYKLCKKKVNKKDAKYFFQTNFRPYYWGDSQNKNSSIMTGYYEPLLQGSLTRDKEYNIPILSPPKDLIKVDLSLVIPKLKGEIVRGRFKNGRIVPYYSRKEITSKKNFKNVICWVKDKVEFFFLQIQGSGRIRLDENQTIFVQYANTNGHMYRSIGNYMLKLKILSYKKMSLKNIKKWAQENPDKIDNILNQNPSYIFFNISKTASKGIRGVVLTAKHSIAADAKYVPFGTPILIKTLHPIKYKPFYSLAIVQDKGSAIKGNRRIDFFWGFGKEAAMLASNTKSKADMIILLPKDYKLN